MCIYVYTCICVYVYATEAELCPLWTYSAGYADRTRLK